MKKIFFLVIAGLLIVSTGCANSKTYKKTSAPDSGREETVTALAAQDRSVAPMTNKEVQIALKNAGYYAGSIDGILGSRSRDAIRKFQQDNGLKDDSVAGPKTQEKLRKYVNTKYKP